MKRQRMPDRVEILTRWFADQHQVPVDAVVSRHGAPRNKLALVRGSIWWMMRDLGFTLPQTAGYFDRHHTTVLHQIKAIDRLLARGSDLDEDGRRALHLILWAREIDWAHPRPNDE